MTGLAKQEADAAQLYDELLVTLIQSGDRCAADRLVARWQPRLAKSARRMLRDDDQALAVLQEAWISILRSIGGLRDPSRFAPWAFGILRRRCIDHIRKARSRRGNETEMKSEIGQPSRIEAAMELDEAFAALSPDHRLAAQLYFVEGMTLAEIAEVQAVPLGTVKTRLFHARRKLKLALGGENS